MGEIDYLIIGTITQDLAPSGAYKLGGSVSYSGRMAAALGCRVGVVTSAANDIDLTAALPDLLVHCVPAERSTTFENIYTSQGREQIIHAIAETLTTTDIPKDWQDAAIVHLAPLAQDVEPGLVHHFPNSLIGITPQGWMRCWKPMQSGNFGWGVGWWKFLVMRQLKSIKSYNIIR